MRFHVFPIKGTQKLANDRLKSTGLSGADTLFTPTQLFDRFWGKPRTLHIEYPGAIHHVLNRGEPILPQSNSSDYQPDLNLCQK
jgi:hypothetical protein